MIEMVRRFLRQRFGSVGIVAALLLFSGLTAFASFGRPGGGPALVALFVLAAGSVSRDVSSGALQMILSRPIRRTEYLFGRYLGILAAFGAFLVLTWILTALMAAVIGAASSSRPDLDLGTVARSLLKEFFAGALTGAVLLFFSTFLPGIADVLAYVILQIVLSPPLKSPALRRALEVARENLLPSSGWLFERGPSSEAAGRYALALTVYLVLAAVIFSRRELPYGQD